ncbi:MAG: ABC transporter ATP-binding protein [Candidatus Poseidoniia archaeon]|nr:ABC transporter ATP-binding protein [Candidatus Poseidoniia archaeon]
MLEIKNLKTRFNTYDGVVKALEGVNLEVKEGEIFGIVGETGCGKSVTGYSLMQLLPRTAEVVAGEIILDGEEITGASDSRMRQIRGGKIGMIFQDPLSALNPVMKVKDQISEVIRQHQKEELENRTEKVDSGNERNPYILWSLIFVSLVSLFYFLKLEDSFTDTFAKLLFVGSLVGYVFLPEMKSESYSARTAVAEMDMVVESLRQVRLPNPSQVANSYPHELSGGMQQRVMIAMALAGRPRLLIADEPTTALDVTIQSQILDLLKKLQKETGMTILMITHDLGVVAEMCDRVAVMYAGTVVETGNVSEIFSNPKHPYTQGLLSALPGESKELSSIGGSVPDLLDPPSGCRFNPRCPIAKAHCSVDVPLLKGEDYKVACHEVKL